MTKEIQLSQDKVAIVDDKDYEGLSQYKWSAIKHRNTWYAVAHLRQSDGSRKMISMHNLIAIPPAGFIVDHIDGNGINNTRDNLRPATNQQNLFNQRLRSTNTSGYKGVCRDKHQRRWTAYIMVDRKKKHLGTFDDIEEAARAYDAACLSLHGEFARPNFR